MATRFSSTLRPDTTVAANFQGWAQFIEDTLVTTGGWVVTGDTGQTLPGSLAIPTSANQRKGYRIYRMNDPLQATAPVFMRLDFGSAATTAQCGLWVTLGSGSDGSGNITGYTWNPGLTVAPPISCQSTSTSAVTNSYGSATPARFSLALFVQSAESYQLNFCLERTKNSLGADTADGLLLIYASGTQNGLDWSRYVSCNPSEHQPSGEQGISYALTTQNPSQTFAPGDIGVGVIIHFKGIAQQPGMNAVVVNSLDVGAENAFVVTLYGTSVTYRQLNTRTVNRALVGQMSQDTSARICFRYD